MWPPTGACAEQKQRPPTHEAARHHPPALFPIEKKDEMAHEKRLGALALTKSVSNPMEKPCRTISHLLQTVGARRRELEDGVHAGMLRENTGPQRIAEKEKGHRGTNSVNWPGYVLGVSQNQPKRHERRKPKKKAFTMLEEMAR